MGGVPLDWANQPDVYKRYPGVKGLPLPREVALPGDRLSAIARRRPQEGHGGPVSLEMLSGILLLGCTLTARARHAGGDFHYRSAPSAGALYPCELYAAVGVIAGMEPGLYHYAVQDHALTPLYLTPLQETLSLYVTAIFFRSAWKYRERAYRYHLLDAGHVLENLVLAFRALRVPHGIQYDFDDEMVNDFLRLDPNQEVCLAVVEVNGTGRETPHTALPTITTRRIPASSPVAPREVDHPLIRQIHAATSHLPERAVEAPQMLHRLGVSLGDSEPVADPTDWPERMNHVEALWSRRSKRNFVRTPLPRGKLDALLASLGLHDPPSLCREASREESVCVGLLAERVEGMASGFYLLETRPPAICRVAAGDLAVRMARACLDQEWLAHAPLHFLFLVNLDVLEAAWGPRGYRYAMMTAGRLGQRLYLAATAMGMGCCGIGALYDEEVSGLLGLNEASKLLYLVAAGPVKK
jgi:SagB-type dehydrogenase family enzyme